MEPNTQSGYGVDPLIPFQCEVKHLFLSLLSTDIPKVEPMNLSMFFHEFLAILVVCTLGGWAPLFERSWVQFLVSLAK